MNNFIDKWKKDKKFKTKIKLLLYTIFVIIIFIYALSINDNQQDIDPINKEDFPITNNSNQNILSIKDNYQYIATIKIDNISYQYTIEKEKNQEKIIKEYDNLIENYLYKDNNYYQLQSGQYILTTKDKVYNVINENYLNIENINKYLSLAEKDNNQYIVYLKDLILGEDSQEYIIILINNNKISIDYTPLMNHFNKENKTYQVEINIIEGITKNKEN